MGNKKNIHLVGSAHLDPVWLWRWPEGCAEVLQTFRSAIDRIGEYKDFVFTCSSAAYYQWVKEIDPALFSKIRDAVRAGRWIPVGGMWVQPDCNMPSLESFARQMLYSQKFYYENFGRICKTGYNVDSFGHNGMLPQLLKKGGMANYVMMRPDKTENKEMPEGLFWWESADGTRVLTFRIPESYTCHGNDGLKGRLASLREAAKEKNHGMMMFYGVGNHGGGPTRADIEYLINKADTAPGEDIVFSSPDAYFEEMLTTMVDLPVWRGDMQHHASGCYSATSLIKAGNRRAENDLYSSEVWDTVSAKKFRIEPSTASFEQAWRKLAFCQFHDILGGCSIMESYRDTADFLGFAETVAAEKKTNALLRISSDIDTWVEGVSEPRVTSVRHEDCGNEFLRPAVIFNSLPYDITVPVRVRGHAERVYDKDGKPVVFANVRSSRSNDSHKDAVILARLPAFGYNTYWLGYEDDGKEKAASPIKAGRNWFENEYLQVGFDLATGAIIRLIDKASGIDFANGNRLGVPAVLKDDKTDTWAHAVFQFQNDLCDMACESAEMVETTGARAVMRIKYTYEKSYLSCDYILGAGQKTIRVKAKALWQEKFRDVKIRFDLGGDEPKAVYDMQGGFIEKVADGCEEPAQKWGAVNVAVGGARRGLAIINNGRYSYDCSGSRISMMALRNVIFADHFSPRPPADFNFTDEGMTRFEYGIYPHTGETRLSDVAKEANIFNIRPDVVLAGYHKGASPQEDSLIRIDKDNVAADALKFSEDGSGSVILRLNETKGLFRTRVSVMSKLFGFAFYTDISANEIKTFRIEKSGKVYDVNFLENSYQ